MSTEAEKLATAYIAHFWAANHEIRWLAIEQELMLWLTPNTLLVGKVDAIGLTPDERPFFLENKTASKYKKAKIEQEKATWRMRPQSLTYGVLLGSQTTANLKGIRSFTTRWAFKTEPPSCDFAWYTYDEPELQWWLVQLLYIADQIRQDRKREGNWNTNLNYCTKYGEKYACPFRDVACHQLNFSAVPDRMKPRTESHLEIENRIRAVQGGAIDMKPEGGYHIVYVPPDLVVLDATRVNDWINCNEYYRRVWEGQGLREESEALEIGGDFHNLIGAHLSTIDQRTK